MARKKHEGGGVFEQLALFFTLVRVFRGEDPKRVAEQTLELVSKAEKLTDEIDRYMRGEQAKPSADAGAQPSNSKPEGSADA